MSKSFLFLHSLVKMLKFTSIVGYTSCGTTYIESFLTIFGQCINVLNYKYAYTTYQKVLIELRSYMRGEHFNLDQFVSKMKVLDEMVNDFCTPVYSGNLETKYEKKYYQPKP